MALRNALLLEQQACFLAEVAYHHTFVAWLIEREVVAVLRGNLLNLHALGQMILQFLFGKQARIKGSMILFSPSHPHRDAFYQ